MSDPASFSGRRRPGAGGGGRARAGGGRSSTLLYIFFFCRKMDFRCAPDAQMRPECQSLYGRQEMLTIRSSGSRIVRKRFYCVGFRAGGSRAGASHAN
ncbi:hypothetical protein EVAR_79687_1 [Eumeta japonica]|uniref:Uncharacterized protein n=1 Tax=Eumeta variegata TaxID=151549 RepID=A0A4C1TC61_EUMVA|nr:hypothetical protein EVAR_79687_1 [Eumeta japonica]